jgi:hypothetical protein
MPFTCISDRFTPTRETFETVEDFQAMCRSAFGEEAKLESVNGGDQWIDESGATVLFREAEVTTREAFVGLFPSPREAQAFEACILGIGSEFLSAGAIAVRDGAEPSAEYWAWLAGQVVEF